MKWVWVNLPGRVLGLENGFLPRDSVQEFSDNQQLFLALRTELDRIAEDGRRVRAQALDDAARRIAEAEEQARLILETAQQTADAQRSAAAEDGYSLGQAMAIEEWHGRHTQIALERSRALSAQKSAMARIVCNAIERLVATADPAALHERALEQIGELLTDVTTATLKVHPSQRDAARRAVETTRHLREAGCEVHVVADATLNEQASIFESSLGVLDASLDVQLKALHAHIDGLLDAEEHAQEDQPNGEPEEQLEVAWDDDDANDSSAHYEDDPYFLDESEVTSPMSGASEGQDVVDSLAGGR